jgi:DNA-binding transcriptional LysR family regulator
LLAAVEGGTLSATSRKLGMPLATVCRKVSGLEAHLRTELVNRTSPALKTASPLKAFFARVRWRRKT